MLWLTNRCLQELRNTDFVYFFHRAFLHLCIPFHKDHFFYVCTQKVGHGILRYVSKFQCSNLIIEFLLSKNHPENISKRTVHNVMPFCHYDPLCYYINTTLTTNTTTILNNKDLVSRKLLL